MGRADVLVRVCEALAAAVVCRNAANAVVPRAAALVRVRQAVHLPKGGGKKEDAEEWR